MSIYNLPLAAFVAALSISTASAQPFAYVANLASNNVSVVNTANLTITTTIPVLGSPSGIAVSPDGAYVWVISNSNATATIISTASNSIVGTVGVGSQPASVAILPNGTQVYVANSGSNSVSIVDAASRTVVGTLGVGATPTAINISSDGRRAYVANSTANTVSVIDTASKTVINTFATQIGPNGICIANNGHLYVANQNSNTVTVHDTTGALLATISGFNFPNSVTANPSGTRIYVTNGNGASVSAVDTSSNTITGTMSVGNTPTSVAFSTDGTRAFVTNETALSLTQLNATTNTTLATLVHVGVYPISVVVSPVNTAPPPCTFTLSASGAAYPATGGSGSVTVTPSSSCGAWTASSNVAWAQITSGASGSGVGTVNYSVSGNSSSGGLSGALTIAGQSYTITEAGAACSYSLSASSISISATGGPASVNVIAPAGCAWTATSGLNWVSITGGASGSGGGTVSYSVAANTASSGRSGSLTIAGQAYTITQAGVACSYSLSATSISIAATGGPSSVNVTSPTGCTWTASSALSWVSITGGASGNGAGTVSYSVAANTSTSGRSGSLTIAGQAYTITQAGIACSYSLSASSISTAATGGPAGVNVVAPAGCTWTASSALSWVSITGGASGNGAGTVSYSVAANTSSSGRSGSLTIAGQAYTITQAGVACSYSLSASSISIAATGGPASVNVIAPAGCTWTANSALSWVLITGGASGNGTGTVSFSVAANTSTSGLSGALTIAGQSYVVTQAGVSCSYSLSAGGISLAATGGPSSVNVIAPPGCAWTATSALSWVSITGGSSGNGSGTVTYSVAANNSTAGRSGALTIAGQTYSIAQTGAACSYSLSSSSGSFAAAGGTAGVSAIAPSGCAWTASSALSWVTITSGATGNGPGTVAYTVSANSGTTRSGSVTVAGQSFTVSQASAACSYSLSATSQNVGAGATSGNITVTANPAGCPQPPVSSNASWITAAISGTTLTWSVAPDLSSVSRSGTLTAAGQTVTIVQAGAACSYSPSPTTLSVSAAGSSGSLAIAAAPGDCAPTSASSGVSWASVAVSGSTAPWSVSTNTSSQARTGFFTVGGKSVTVSQSGGLCAYSLSATSLSIGAGGISGNIAVTPSPSDCAPFTASSNVSWASVSVSGNTVFWSVSANASAQSRAGSLTVAGQNVGVTQAAAGCSYSVNPTSLTAGASGSSGNIAITATPSNCPASSASSSMPWASIAVAGSTAAWSVSANGGTQSRGGTFSIAGQSVQVTQSGANPPALPSVALTHSTLTFAVSGSSITGPQTVGIVFTGGAAAWTATSNKANITVTPASGSGSGSFVVSATPGSNGTILVSVPGASNPLLALLVNISSNVTPGLPFGSLDTPADGTTGVAGAIAISGWALDPIQVDKVDIWRDPVAGEPSGLVYIGDALFVDGARPDVAAANPNIPFNSRAGWGYLLLTNFLPGGSGVAGNGTYRIHAIAHGHDGGSQEIGAHQITVDNAHATRPFGSIDTPNPGTTISGNAFVNFGWALTQNPYFIPADGSTITVTIDGVAVGHPTYNQYRSDIANSFPGLANSSGPVGFFRIDTTQLANGMHTLSWLVYDNAGRGDGVGSRFINVSNSGSSAAAFQADQIEESARNLGEHVAVEELGRIELKVGAVTGYLVAGDEQRPLPTGSVLQGGVFYWQLGPGFHGAYPLEFQRPDGSSVRINVTVGPKTYRATSDQ